MVIKRVKIDITTDGAGAGTHYSPYVNGRILAMRLVLGTLSTPDLTVTLETTGVAVLTVTGVAASTTWQPRPPTHDESNGGELTRWSGGHHVGDAIPVDNERVKCVTAGAGAATSGTLYIWIDGIAIGE